MPGYPKVLHVAEVSPQLLRLLATCPFISYIDRANTESRQEAELTDADLTANNIATAQSLFPQLTGRGMSVSVKEEPFDPEDLDIRGRVTIPSELRGGFSRHATVMATYMAGAGNSSPLGKGVAGEAGLFSASFGELFPDDAQALLENGISVQNHSYGVGVENYYGLEATAYDQQTHLVPQLLHVFSSGNSGDKSGSTGAYAGLEGFGNLTGQFKTSKNTLCVGALEPDGQVGLLSSRGPTYDGRIKPEVVAHGKGGTSEAAAVVSGIALLVQQAYKEQHGQALPPSSLVKALLVNSADDVGRPEVDFEAGFGNVDAMGAVRTVKENRFTMGIASQGQEKVYRITVPEGVGQLKATLVWHEAEASPSAQQALLHDLDLTVRHLSTGREWEPWVLNSFPHVDSLTLPARRGKDRLNNVEQVTVEVPDSGIYELRVSGYSVTHAPQPYSLAYEYESGTEWLYPVRSASMLAGQLNRIRWQSRQVQAPARLEYRFTDSPKWNLVVEDADAATPYFDWLTPDTIALAQLKVTIGSEAVVSEKFVLTKQLQLNLGYACEGNMMVHWTGLSGVEQYQVYSLGETHMQPLHLVADTLLTFKTKELPGGAEFLAVAPVIQGEAGLRSLALHNNKEEASCYIVHFLPPRLIMDSVALELQLSTTYQLASLSLERRERGTYRLIKTISPVERLSYQLHDPQPMPGKNEYRIKITNQAGASFYSQTEDVIYATDDFMQVYPNPVEAGKSFYVALRNETAELELFDRMGKLLYSSSAMGVLKEVPTKGLPDGLYLLRLKTEQGRYIQGKVLVQ